MKKLALIALGGNALLKDGEKGTISELERNTAETCRYLLPLIRNDWQIVLTHGNGPQVGNTLIQHELAKDVVPAMPLDVCVSETQGSLGYILQQGILNELRRNKIERYVVTMVTQVVVDSKDQAFSHPTKPVGPFYTKDQAETLKAEKKWTMIEDSGRGFRRVVPSPTPVKIIQRIMIKELAQSGHIVIAVGGGGIPIYKKADNDYEGIEAVIDKDLASSILAAEIKAGVFIILTTVPRVFINFGKPNQQGIVRMTVSQAKKYLDENQFGTGSMKPKIESAINYLTKYDGKVIITSAEHLAAALGEPRPGGREAIEGRSGTTIISDVKKKEDEGNLLLDFSK
ncbi:MAG TPA: carbamate kinase [Planctomycetota bacterium]|nr:carbamate kinase [Planctomycetota bacterium]